MFLKDTEIELMNRKISELVSELDEAGLGDKVNLNKPDALDATLFMKQRDKHDSVIAATLLLKQLGPVVAGGAEHNPLLKHAMEEHTKVIADGMAKSRESAITNLVCALMVYRHFTD